MIPNQKEKILYGIASKISQLYTLLNASDTQLQSIKNSNSEAIQTEDVQQQLATIQNSINDTRISIDTEKTKQFTLDNKAVFHQDVLGIKNKIAEIKNTLDNLKLEQ